MYIPGQGERVIREQQHVIYHGGCTRFGSPMFGKMILTNIRFAFQKQRIVEYGGLPLLGFGMKKELHTLGTVINIPIIDVICATLEVRARKKGTLNTPPSFFSREEFQLLIVSAEFFEGIENPRFEVYKAEDWVMAINYILGEQVENLNLRSLRSSI